MGAVSSLLSLVALMAVSAVNIGDRAPKFLEETLWLKGSPPMMEKTITIVELWQSSCGHCRDQIPHLTTLQEIFGDQLSIAALSPEPINELRQFVEKNRDDIGYSVGHIPNEVASRFFGENQSIPYAYVIDPNGILLWKGPPAAIDDALEKIMAGSFELEKSDTILSLENDLIEAVKTSRITKISGAVDDLLAYDPGNAKGLEVGIDIAKYRRDPAYLKEIIDQVPLSGFGAGNANKFAKLLISDGEFAYQYPDAALRFISYALQKDPENAEYMDTYARLFYSLGDLEKAIEWETKAMENTPGDPTYQYNLEHYRRIKEIRASMK